MNNLEQILVQHYGAVYKPIYQLSRTPCLTSDYPVIEFDEVSRNFCQSLAQSMKSADGLYIYQSSKKIYFIEIKDIGTHIKWNSKKKNFFKEFDEFQEEQNASIRQKIEDSIFLIIAATGQHAPYAADTAEILNRQLVKIYYLVVAPMSDKDYVTYSIGTNLFKPIRHALLTGKDPQAIFINSDEAFNEYINKYFEKRAA